MFFLFSDKPTNNHSFLPLFGQTLTGDFLGWVKINHKANAATVKERCRCYWWVVFKFFIFWYVNVFSLLLGVAEFCINKISMELCGFVCGFCIFVWLICGFLFISFNFVSLSFCLYLYLDCVGFIQIFLCGHVSTGKLCIAMLLWVSIFSVICKVWWTELI